MHQNYIERRIEQAETVPFQACSISQLNEQHIPEELKSPLYYLTDPFDEILDQMKKWEGGISDQDRLLYLFRILTFGNLSSTRHFKFFLGNPNVCEEPEFQLFLYDQPKELFSICELMCNDFRYLTTEQHVNGAMFQMKRDSRAHRFYMLHTLHFSRQLNIYNHIQQLMGKNDWDTLPLNIESERKALNFYMLRTNIETSNPSLKNARKHCANFLTRQNPKDIEKYITAMTPHWGKKVQAIFDKIKPSDDMREYAIKALNAAIFFPSFTMDIFKADSALKDLSKIIILTARSYDKNPNHIPSSTIGEHCIKDYLQATNQSHGLLDQASKEIIKSHHNFAFRLFINRIINQLEIEKTQTASSRFKYQITDEFELSLPSQNAQVDSITESVDKLFNTSEYQPTPASLKHDNEDLVSRFHFRQTDHDEISGEYADSMWPKDPEIFQKTFRQNVIELENNFQPHKSNIWGWLSHYFKLIFSMSYKRNYEAFIEQQKIAPIRADNLVANVRSELATTTRSTVEADACIENLKRQSILPQNQPVH